MTGTRFNCERCGRGVYAYPSVYSSRPITGRCFGCKRKGAMTYEELGAEIGRLVEEKNRAYGASFQKAGDIMRILYPDGITPEKMDDALTIVRMLDKMFRIASDKDAFGESPYRDLCGYALLGAKRSAG